MFCFDLAILKVELCLFKLVHISGTPCVKPKLESSWFWIFINDGTRTGTIKVVRAI